MGLQACDFNTSGFVRTNPAPRTDVVYHQVQTGQPFPSAYAGAWGIRLLEIAGEVYVIQSDLNYGLIIDCFGCEPPQTPAIAFVSTRDGNREIYAMNADGSNPVNLTNNPSGDGTPA